MLFSPRRLVGVQFYRFPIDFSEMCLIRPLTGQVLAERVHRFSGEVPVLPESSPKAANNQCIRNKQGHSDREQDDPDSNVLTQYGFNFFAQLRVRDLRPIIMGFWKNTQQAIVNRPLPRRRKECSTEVHLE